MEAEDGLVTVILMLVHAVMLFVVDEGGQQLEL